jgi:hypothetical protein
MKSHILRRSRLIVGALTLWVGLASSAWAWPPTGVPPALGPGDRAFARVAADGSGGCFVVWYQAVDDTGGPSQVYAQHLNPGGVRTWGSGGVPVATKHATQSLASLVPDGKGGIVVSLIDGDRNRTFNDIVVQRLSASGEKIWGEAGVVAGSVYVFPPLLVADGSGGAIVVFSNYDPTTGEQVMAQHVSAAGALLWPAPGIHVADGEHQSDPVAIEDGSGGAIVAWIQGYPDPTGQAQRVSFEGQRLWSDQGVVLGHQMTGLAISSDAQGASLVGWLDTRNFTPDHGAEIYAQKLDGNGSPVWTPGGVAASREDAGKLHVRVAPDGEGGAFVTWEQASLRPLEIAAQRVNASGAAVWAPNGLVVSPAGYSVYSHDMAPDGRGGLFVGCYHVHASESPTLDLLARHLGPKGSFAESSGPTTLSNAAAEGVDLASDDLANAFVGWTDHSGASDVLVSKLRPEPARGGRLLRPISTIEPNPARGAFQVAGALPLDSPARLELIDLRGRLVATRVIVPAAGLWSTSFGGNEHLASGTYVLRVIQGSAVSSAKVSVIR